MESRASQNGKSTPAPEKDRIKGSDRNAEGSAKNASGRISVSLAARVALKNKVRDHNESMREAGKPSWSRTTVGQLLAVYRRGAGAFSTSHRPGIGRAAWAMARVNAYLHLLRSGRPKNPKYVTDNDLLPPAHPRHSSRRSYEFEIEERSISLRPPAGMAAAARRGLELHEEGRSGDGLKPETVARAKRIAAREVLTEAHVREMRAWFRRHKVDRRPGWGDRGNETPGYTAWMLWGGDAGWKWSEVKAARLDREDGTEQRGRMGVPRSPKRNKKAKARPGRPAKVGPSAGCGTGSGGFKAGNNCAKEDGIPRKPFSMGGALKQGPKGELQAVKAQIAIKQAKVASKQAKQKAVNKQVSIAAKKGKAAIRKKQKEDKAAEAQKQADAAAAAKKKSMLQKIRVKKANEKLPINDKTFAPAKQSPKTTAKPAKEAGESELDYQMRINKKDFDEIRSKILADHEKIVGAAEANRKTAVAALDAARVDRESRLADLRSLDPKGSYFLDVTDGKTSLVAKSGSKFKKGDKEFDETESAIRAEDAAIDARDAAYSRERAASGEFRRAAWERIGELRDGRTIDASARPIVMKQGDVDSLNSYRSGGGVRELSAQEKMYAPDEQVSSDVAAAMQFYSAVGGDHLSGVVSSIRVAKIHGQKTAHASRVIQRSRNDYDFDDTAVISQPDAALEAFSKVIAPVRKSPAGPTHDAPFIGLNGFRGKTKDPVHDPAWMEETAVHEIAHPIGQARSANSLANDFWKKRWEEHGRPELKKYSSDKSREHQRTFDDRWFRSSYAGVTYPRGSSQSRDARSPDYVQNNVGNFFDTEIITMGAQGIYSNPKQFLEQDPEHFFFVAGVLSGRFFRK